MEHTTYYSLLCVYCISYPFHHTAFTHLATGINRIYTVVSIAELTQFGSTHTHSVGCTDYSVVLIHCSK